VSAMKRMQRCLRPSRPYYPNDIKLTAAMVFRPQLP
jgi:hypothetical protein